MENKKTKRILRIAGIAGIVTGLGMVFMLKNPKGWIIFVIGVLLTVKGVINGR